MNKDGYTVGNRNVHQHILPGYTYAPSRVVETAYSKFNYHTSERVEETSLYFVIPFLTFSIILKPREELSLSLSLSLAYIRLGKLLELR